MRIKCLSYVWKALPFIEVLDNQEMSRNPDAQDRAEEVAAAGWADHLCCLCSSFQPCHIPEYIDRIPVRLPGAARCQRCWQCCRGHCILCNHFQVI